MLHKFKVTTVYVTHDQQEAIFMGDKIAVMRKGKLEQYGTFDDLYFTPANLFVATFIGTPPMSIIPAQVAGDKLMIGQQGWTLPANIAATLSGQSQVRLGMRAEGWEVDTPDGISSEVRHIERIPTEQAAFTHGTIGGNSVTIVIPIDHPEVKSLRVTPKWDQTYFFDAVTETALLTPGVPDLF